MSEHIDTEHFQIGLKRVLPVADFARRYRLSEQEEKRLKSLFGDFASQHELLMNADRSPRWR